MSLGSLKLSQGGSSYSSLENILFVSSFHGFIELTGVDPQTGKPHTTLVNRRTLTDFAPRNINRLSDKVNEN